MTIGELNVCDRDRFVAALGWIFEGSPWVASRAWQRRPFASRDDLHRAMVDAVSAADRAEQFDLLCAHPDLGARARMSDASADEQAGAGLDRLTAGDLTRLRRATEEYRTRFGFPFLLAVRNRTTHEIIEAVERRLSQNAEAEWQEALQQTFRIAELRLRDVVE
jgi:OHCU decarboxylase